MTTKISKWDIKKALKLLGLEVNEENLSKVDKLRGVEASSQDEKEEEPTLSLTDTNETATIVGIVRVNNNSYNVVKANVNLKETEVVYNTDSEPRAILERGKVEAELKALEFRKLKKEGKL